jgi:hypothetical protein
MRYRAQRLTRDIWFRFAAPKFAFVSLQQTSDIADTLGEMRYRAQRLTRDIWFRFAAHKFTFVSLQQTSDIADTLYAIQKIFSF